MDAGVATFSENAVETASGLLTTDMFTSFTEILTNNLGIVIPVGIAIFGITWGIKKAISVFKGIAK